mgnify:FL=1
MIAITLLITVVKTKLDSRYDAIDIRCIMQHKQLFKKNTNTHYYFTNYYSYTQPMIG